jgi:hypothetical protein
MLDLRCTCNSDEEQHMHHGCANKKIILIYNLRPEKNVLSFPVVQISYINNLSSTKLFLLTFAFLKNILDFRRFFRDGVCTAVKRQNNGGIFFWILWNGGRAKRENFMEWWGKVRKLAILSNGGSAQRDFLRWCRKIWVLIL